MSSHNLEVRNDREFRQRGQCVKIEKGEAGGEKKNMLACSQFFSFSPHPSSLSFYGSQDGGRNQCTSELLLKEMWNIVESGEAEKTLFFVSLYSFSSEKVAEGGGESLLNLPVAKTLTHIILIDSILPFLSHQVLSSKKKEQALFQ